MTRTKALLVVLAFLALSAGFADWRVLALTGNVASNQQSTTKALCSFREDLQKRVTSGDDFLKKHPNGIPGIPVATIKVSIVNEKHTLVALHPLVCP